MICNMFLPRKSRDGKYTTIFDIRIRRCLCDFRVPEGEAWDPVNDENMKTTDLSKPNSNVYYAKIPIKYVLDAVEAVNNESKMNANVSPVYLMQVLLG